MVAASFPWLALANGDFGVNEPGLDQANEPRPSRSGDEGTTGRGEGGSGCSWIALAFVVTCLLGTGLGSVAARSPEPLSEGQTIEIPEAGFALTVPGDWRVGVHFMESDPMYPADVIGSDVQQTMVMTTTAPEGLETGTCSVFRYLGTGMSAETFTARTVAWLGGPENRFGWSGRVESDPVQIPAGEAIRVDVASDLIGRPGADFILNEGDTIFVLACRGVGPPEHDWRSIAETFEFLPEEELSGLAEPSPSASPSQAAPREPLGLPVEGGLIEKAGSGFAITFPEGWTVEIADPDTDVFGAKPGTAWEALRASAHDGSMACSVVVGVAEVPLHGSRIAMGDVTKPFWDPDEPDMLWVPTPYLPKTGSTHGTSWIRRQSQDDDLGRDVQYELLCAANNAVVSRPAPIFQQFAKTFEFLPVEE